MLNKIKQDLIKLKNPAKIKVYQWFFRTGKGQYGEGDEFLGLSSKQVADIAKKYYQDVSFADLRKLLNNKIHEFRMTAVRILVLQYQTCNAEEKEKIYNFYLANAKKIDNWDLVDVSCHKIIGNYLLIKEKAVLYKLARSKNLWERRIAIISTYEFIRNSKFTDTIKISEILLRDDHDLIHKAVGWMLREVGKRDVKVLEKFLDKNVKKMPRTALRYAIEKFPEKTRKAYLKR